MNVNHHVLHPKKRMYGATFSSTSSHDHDVERLIQVYSKLKKDRPEEYLRVVVQKGVELNAAAKRALAASQREDRELFNLNREIRRKEVELRDLEKTPGASLMVALKREEIRKLEERKDEIIPDAKKIEYLKALKKLEDHTTAYNEVKNQ